MTTITVQFQSNGQKVKKTAILTDTLDELSKSQKNECFDFQIETWADGYWSLFFEGEPGTQYEIEMEFDTDNRQQTLKPIKAITWEGDVITDVQTATAKIR